MFSIHTILIACWVGDTEIGENGMKCLRKGYETVNKSTPHCNISTIYQFIHLTFPQILFKGYRAHEGTSDAEY